MYSKSKVSGGIVEVEKRAWGRKNGQTNRDKKIVEMWEKTEKVLKSEGKKINWKDGVAALIHIVHFNLFTSIKTAFHRMPEFPENKKGSSAYSRELPLN